MAMGFSVDNGFAKKQGLSVTVADERMTMAAGYICTLS